MSSIYDISGSALLAQRRRMQLIASNIANADSTVSAGGRPYQARFAYFEAKANPDGTAGVKVGGVVTSDAPAQMMYRPGSPLANDQGYVEGSNVSLVNQMVDLVDATKNYQANLSVITQRQQLNRALIQQF